MRSRADSSAETLCFEGVGVTSGCVIDVIFGSGPRVDAVGVKSGSPVMDGPGMPWMERVGVGGGGEFVGVRVGTAYSMTEPQAFKWIQRTAMDHRMTMREVADRILAESPTNPSPKPA